MRESLYFVYDSIKSMDMGVIQVNIDGGLFEEQFLSSRSIREEKIRGRKKPYFYEVEEEPLSIPIGLWFDTGLSEENRRKVARWLNQPFYKELYFSEQPDRRFYAMYVGSPSLLHNGIEEGYVQLEMRCDTSHSYSPVYISDIYDLSDNVDSTEITFTNNGDLDCEPVLYISKVGNGDISIINNSDSGIEFKLTGLVDGENLTIDNENEEIETDLVGTYRYNDHNGVFLTIPRGVNRLQVFGEAKLQFKYQFHTLG
jgi:phage-related protein